MSKEGDVQLGLDRMELPPSAIHPGQRRRKADARHSSAPLTTQQPGSEISSFSVSDSLVGLN